MTNLSHSFKTSFTPAQTPVWTLGTSIVAALLVLGVLFSAYRFTPPFVLPVGEQDAGVYRDFYALESAGAMTYRWTGNSSQITLPQVGNANGALLDLAVWIPEEQSPKLISIFGEAIPLITTEVHGARTLAMLVPQAVTEDGDASFSIQTRQWYTPGDPRLLGVAIRDIAWRGIGNTFPPLRQLWLFPALVVLLAGLGRRIGYRLLPSGAVVTVLAAGLAVGAAHWPLEVAPYVHRIVLIVVLGHVGLLLWSALSGSRQRPWTLPQEIGPSALVVLLGIGHWMLLPYQWALCAEVGSAVCPRPGLQIIGPIVLGLLVVAALVPRLASPTRLNIALGVLAIGSVAAAMYAFSFALRRSGPDFFIHWRAAFNFNLGRPLYEIAEIRLNHFGHAFKLPPFDAMIYLPWATADDNKVLFGQRIVNALLYLASGGLLISFLRPRLHWAAATAAVVVVMGLMQPAFDTIAYGQTDILILFLLVLMLLGLRRGWNVLPGAVLALGIIVKLYLLLWIGFLFLRRQWRVLLWTAVAFVLLNGVAVAVMGWHNHVVFVREVLPILGGGSSWVENQTINGFLSRLLTDTLRTDPIRDPLITLLTNAAFGIIAGITILLASVPSAPRSSTMMLQFSSLAVVMPLAIPAAWMHYSTSTILPFVALIWYIADKPLRLRHACWVALAFGLIAFGNQWSFFNGTRHPGLPELGLSYKGYGLMLLWLVTIHALTQTLEVRAAIQRFRSWPFPGGFRNHTHSTASSAHLSK